MKKIKLIQTRSVIDRPKRQKDTMIALGLRKINHSVIKDLTPQVQGMITKVSHLLKVEEI